MTAIECLTLHVLLVAAFVNIVSCLANSNFVIVIVMVTRPLLKFVSLYIINTGALSLSKWKPFFYLIGGNFRHV